MSAASEPSKLSSAFYLGQVRHRRFWPKRHSLNARTAWLYLDLEEWESGGLQRSGRLPRWLSLGRRWPVGVRRADLLGPLEQPLSQALRQRVARELGFEPTGPMGVLTLGSALGIGFNPVSFYYCWEPTGRGLQAVLAEITNTPWLERHAYALDLRSGRGPQRFQKRFHVSPFIGMDVDYAWGFSAPGERLSVHMEDLQREPGVAGLEPGAKLFDATLTLQRGAWGAGSGLGLFLRLLLQPLLVLGAIYLHAAWLYLRGVRFHAHPKGSGSEVLP